MFGDLSFCTIVKHGVLKILHDGFIMAKWSKISGLYILDGFVFIICASSISEKFHDKNKLCFNALYIYLEVVLDHYNKFCRRQMIKMHLTTFSMVLG